jgi:hypothetical protein
MSGAPSEARVAQDDSSLIWVTRGLTWGFRFLRDGEFEDPLLVYDAVFSGVEDGPKACRRVPETVALTFPDRFGRQRRVARAVALRFPDPRGWQDASGRVIPHEFVVFPPIADDIDSVEDGLRVVRRLLEEEFAQVWEKPTPDSLNG